MSPRGLTDSRHGHRARGPGILFFFFEKRKQNRQILSSAQLTEKETRGKTHVNSKPGQDKRCRRNQNQPEGGDEQLDATASDNSEEQTSSYTHTVRPDGTGRNGHAGAGSAVTTFQQRKAQNETASQRSRTNV